MFGFYCPPGAFGWFAGFGLVTYLIVAAVCAVLFVPLAVLFADGRGDAVARVAVALVFALAWPITFVVAVTLAIAYPFVEEKF